MGGSYGPGRPEGYILEGGKAIMTHSKISKTLIRLILKWMNNKKTGSLQINFVKGRISNLIEHRAISLENNENWV
jgi:hypothetical protein